MKVSMPKSLRVVIVALLSLAHATTALGAVAYRTSTILEDTISGSATFDYDLTTVVSGDFLLGIYQTDQSGVHTVGPTSGWTQDDTHQVTADGQRVIVQHYPNASGSLGNPYSISTNFTNPNGWGRILMFSGTDSTTPMPTALVVTDQNTAQSSPATVTFPSITPGVANCLIVLVVMFDKTSTSPVPDTSSVPSGFTRQIDDPGSGTWDAWAVATKSVTSSGATGTFSWSVTWSSGTAGWAAYTIALAPPGGAAPTRDGQGFFGQPGLAANDNARPLVLLPFDLVPIPAARPRAWSGGSDGRQWRVTSAGLEAMAR